LRLYLTSTCGGEFKTECHWKSGDYMAPDLFSLSSPWRWLWDLSHEAPQKVCAGPWRPQLGMCPCVGLFLSSCALLLGHVPKGKPALGLLRLRLWMEQAENLHSLKAH
jgi:hypothetical protein